MDFIDRLKDEINSIPNLPLPIMKGYPIDKESLVIYPISGGQVIQEYYDNIKDQQLNYEIRMKSKDGDLIEKTLWLISDFIDSIENITSKDNSFEFNSLTIANQPFINNANEQGWFEFLLNAQAQITTFEEENK